MSVLNKRGENPSNSSLAGIFNATTRQTTMKGTTMKNLKIVVAGLLAGCLFSVSAQASDNVQLDGAKLGHWTMDYDAAAKLAKEKNVPMMINFTGSDWCDWCKLMDKDVFAKEGWKKYAAANAVLVTIDFPSDKTGVPEKYVARNEGLKKEFGVRGYPTYIVLDSDGKTRLGQLGAGKGMTPDAFIEKFKETTRFSSSAIAAIAKKDAKKGESLKKTLGEYRGATQSLREWIATGPEKNEANDKKYAAFKKQISDAQAKLSEF
jgi:thioredoxin-related protein